MAPRPTGEDVCRLHEGNDLRVCLRARPFFTFLGRRIEFASGDPLGKLREPGNIQLGMQSSRAADVNIGVVVELAGFGAVGQSPIFRGVVSIGL